MKQVIFGGGYYDLLHDTNTEYNSLIGMKWWELGEPYMIKLVSTDGVIKNLRVMLTGAPGAGKHYTFTLRVNGALTALTFDISNLETSGSNMVDEVVVTGGDYVSLQCDPDGTPTNVYATWTSLFSGDTAKESLILGGTGNFLSNIATEYGQVMGDSTNWETTEDLMRQVVPTAGTIKNFYVRLNTDPGTAPDAYRFTVRLNGATVAQSPIVTIVANDITGNDLVHELDVVAGDVLTMMCEPLNSPSATPHACWGLTFVADIDGESIVLGGCHNDLHNVNTEYNALTSFEGNTWTATEAERYQLGQVCTLSKLHILLNGSPGVGNKYDFTIRIAGAGSAVVATVDGANTTGNSGVLEDTVGLDDYVDLEVDPDSTPAVRDAYWGCVSYIDPHPLEQVIFGGYYNLTHGANTEYNLLNGGTSWGGGGINPSQMISTDGVIKNLRVRLIGAPGVGKHHTFTLMVNGALTALTLDITDLEQTGSNMVNQVAVTGGDYVYIQHDPDGAPPGRYAYWTSVFESIKANESLILSGATSLLDSGVIHYGMVMSARTTTSNVENDHRVVVPTAGTIKNLYVKLSADPGTAPEAYRFTLRKGGVNQTLTVTITADDTTGSDLVNSFAVAAGDVLTMMIEPLNAPSVTPQAFWGMTFVADIDGESIVMGGSWQDLDAAATEYQRLSTAEGISWSGDGAQRRSLGQICILRKLHVLLSAAPGAGNTYTFTIRIASADSNVVAAVAGAATTGNSAALEDIVTLDKYVDLKVVPADTPDVADAYWGFVVYRVGWPGNISGVTYPAEVAGVPVANIAEVKGVA